MKKFAWQLVALVVAVCMVAATAGIVPTLAHAEGLTVGATTAYHGAAINGVENEAGKTLVTWTTGDGSGAEVHIDVTNYEKEPIAVTLEAKTDLTVTLYLLTTTDIDETHTKWSTIYSESKTGTAGGTVEFAWTGSEIDVNVPSVDLFLRFAYSTGSELSAVIDSWTVGGISYTAPAYVAPPEEVDPITLAPHAEWKKSANVTIADSAAPVVQEDKIKDGMGLVTFDDTDLGTFTPDGGEAQENKTYVKIPLKTGDPKASGEKNLYIKYKASAGISDMLLFANGLDSTNKGDPDDAELNFPNGTFICAGVISKAWNVTLSDTTPDGYKLAEISMGDYLTTGWTGKTDTVDSLLIVFEFTDPTHKAGESVDFAGIMWSNTKPVFASDTLDVPAAKITGVEEYTNGNGNYTSVEFNAVADEATGAPAGLVKVVYDSEHRGYGFQMTYENFTTSRTRMVIKYWSKERFNLRMDLYDGTKSEANGGHTTVTISEYKFYDAGEGYIDLDLTGRVYDESGKYFRCYLDSKSSSDRNPDVTSNIFVLESVKVVEPTSIGDLYKEAWVDRFTLTEGDEGTEVSYPAKTGTEYNVVKADIKNWDPVDRFLKISFSSVNPVALAVYQGDINTILGATSFPAGDNVAYVDTSKASQALESDWTMHIFIDAWADSEANTVTFKSFEFVKTGTQNVPAASALTIDYAAETVTFDDTAIEVFSDADGSTAVASGSTVTPGATLYFRAKAAEALEASAMATLTLPARPAAPASVTPTTVTDSVIAIAGADYATLEFRLGAGAWGVGSFTDLDPETEYTIEYRVKATDSAFASETKTIKVTTTAASGTTPGGEGGKPASDKGGCGKGCGGMVAGFGGLAALLVAGAFVALKRK